MILGFRHFLLSIGDGRLHCAQPRFGWWNPGVNAAECKIDKIDTRMGYTACPVSPSSIPEQHMCGLHAWNSVKEIDTSTYRVSVAGEDAGELLNAVPISAAVVGWGTINEYERGWASSHARVLALGMKPEWLKDEHADVRLTVERIKKSYNLITVLEQYLEAVAQETHLRLSDQSLDKYEVRKYERPAPDTVPAYFGPPFAGYATGGYLSSFQRRPVSVREISHGFGRIISLIEWSDGAHEQQIEACMKPSCQRCFPTIGLHMPKWRL